MFRTFLLRFVLVTALVSALIGGAYSYAAHGRLVLGGVFGAAFGVIFPALEFLLQGEKGARLRRLPFLVFFGVRAGIYVAVILAIEFLGAWLMIGPEAVRDLSLFDFAFSLAVSVVGNLFFAIASLLGPGVLFAFAAGRYHRPRSEERALLFIDLCGSTAKAERLGQERFLAFLDAFIVDVTYDIVDDRRRDPQIRGRRGHRDLAPEARPQRRRDRARLYCGARPARRPPRGLRAESSAKAPISAPRCTRASSRSAKSAPSRRRSR